MTDAQTPDVIVVETLADDAPSVVVVHHDGDVAVINLEQPVGVVKVTDPWQPVEVIKVGEVARQGPPGPPGADSTVPGPQGEPGPPGPPGVPPEETDGANNTHYGLNSGMYGAGQANSALGQQALQVIFGANNVGVGYNAGKEINQGNHNVAIGFGALYAAGGNAANMTFNQNLHVGVGYASGAYAPGTGDAITAVGGYAVAHTQATAIGYDAQAQGAYSTAIGVGSRATADHQIVLGTAAENVAIPGTLTVAGSPVWKAWSGTQAEYDAIAVKDPGTLYAVAG